MSVTDLLRRAHGQVARYARMTREDGLELTAVFCQVASRQARDAGTDARRVLGELKRRAEPKPMFRRGRSRERE